MNQSACFLRAWIAPFVLILSLILPLPLWAGNEDPYDPSKIKEFTGAPTKVVWIQDSNDMPALDAERPTLRLMGLSTEDNKGERAILPDLAAYIKPLITADGTRVVFGDKLKKTVSVVNWDGTGLKVLLENANFADVWTDPATGVEWFYAQVQEPRDGKDVPVIRRYRMDNPKVSELVWDKMPIFMFTLSGDGRSASGGGDGGNSPQGFLTLPNGDFTQRAGGCWPSIAPDNSNRMWVFTGNHRSVHFFVPTSRSGVKALGYTIRFDQAPGLTLTSREEVHRIRWSNNTRFMVCSSPFSEWDYKGQVKVPYAVSQKIEIYIGKYSEDMKTLERWMRVTSNDKGDYWADVWIKPGEGAQAAAVELPTGAAEEEKAEKLDQRGLVYTWETQAVGNQIEDPETKTIRQCSGLLKDRAKYGLNFAMDLTGGWFLPDQASAAPLLKACQASNALTVELIITPQAEPADDRVVMLFGQNIEDANAALLQRGAKLYLRLKAGSGQPQELELGSLEMNKPNHVMFSYAKGNLLCTINGRKAMLKGSFTGDFSGWKEGALVFGAQPDGSKGWSGLLEGIRIFSREMPAKELHQRYLAQKAERKDRKPVEPVIVEAKLVTHSPGAKLQQLGTYTRCLNLQIYEVQKVLKGELADKKIGVYQWSILGSKVLPEYEAMKEGSTQTLVLMPYAGSAQENELKVEGDSMDEVKIFYDGSPPPAESADIAAGKTVEWKTTEGGTWAQADRWSDGKVPMAQDSVVLGSMAQGTREVQTTAPVTIHALSLKQDGPATNVLKLGGSFSILGSGNPLELPANPAAVLNANGQDLEFKADSLKEVGFNGTVKLSGNGRVTAVTVVDGGLDYTRRPDVKLSGSGKNAVAEAGMELASIQCTHLGEGYTTDPVVTVSEPDIVGGRQAVAVARVDKKSGALSDIRISDPGSGYMERPTVTITGGEGKGAQAEAFLSVSEVYVLNGGEGYSEPPVVEFTGGEGLGARALAATQSTVLKGTSDSADVMLLNRGKLEQQGGRIIFDWMGASKQVGKREFRNEGEWILNHGSIKFISSTGLPNWFGNGNVNVGTLRILDHSWVGTSSFTNNGEIELGLGATVGQLEFAQSECIFRNEGKGVVRVTGGTVEDPAVFGINSLISNAPREARNGSEKEAGTAQWIIGNGKDPAAFRVTGGQARMTNYPGCRIELNWGASLLLETNDAGARHRFERREAKLTNLGDMLFAGDLYIRSNHGSFGGIENGGKLVIEGDATRLLRLQNSVGPGGLYRAPDYTSLILNRGELQGSGKFSYVDKTGEEEAAYMRIINLGNLSPGGKAPGKWTLENLNVYFGAVPPPDDGKKKEEKPLEGTGTLTIRVAGPAASGSLEIKGEKDYGQFILAEGAQNILNLVPEPGVKPSGTYRIVTAAKVTGTFPRLQYEGKDQVPYKVNYLPDGIDVVFP